jgi:hypothetical protein
VIVPAVPRQYLFANATTGGHSIVVKTPSGTGITIAASSPYVYLYCDGTNVLEVAANDNLTLEVNGTSNGSQALLNLKNGTNVTITDDGSGGITIAASSGTTTGGVSAKTSNYNVASGDNATLLTCNSATAFTLTLLGTPPSSTWFIFVKNVGTGAVTIARNGLTIDGASSNVTLLQGDAEIILTDGTNYFTGMARPLSIAVFMSGIGTNSQVLLYLPLDRTCIFPASAPNAQAKANTAATGSTTYTFKKNGTSFATVAFSASGTTGTFTQASAATFAAGDILEIDGPSSADATLANMGITLQGYRF